MLTYLSTRRRDSGFSSEKQIRKSSRLRSRRLVRPYSVSYGHRPSSPCLFHPPYALLMCVRVCLCACVVGVQGSNPQCMIRQINTILSSAMNEQQLTRACNFRVASKQAQDVWKSYGGTDRLADACATPNADMYSDYLYGCCPEDRFWSLLKYSLVLKYLTLGTILTDEPS